jgi:predicted HicB family RNase H-like nuclease
VKSESATFRIDSKALKSLRHEAGQKDISTNTLVNQIIKDHLNWHSNAAKAGFIAVRRPLISKLINNLSEQEIISLAEYVAKAANKDVILLMENEYTIKSVLDFLEYWVKISGYAYRHEETNNGQNKHSYVIQHDMGKKWSIYLASLYQFLFDELEVNIQIEFYKTENTLAFMIDSG